MNFPSCDTIGIVATLIMLYSFTQSEYKKLQQANIVADMFFAFYGLMIGSISVIILNMSLAIATTYVMFHRQGFQTAVRFGVLVAFATLCISLCVFIPAPQIEYLGVLANIIMMIGFTSPQQRTMRICGIIASVIYVVYGTTCTAIPLVISNLIAISMHCVMLRKLSKNN